MPIERVTLDLDSTALYVARAAAESKQMSLSQWISQAVRAKGIAEGAELSAHQERLHPDEPPGWADDLIERMFSDAEE
ncbi:MAG: hypothetical protein ABW022_16150 [Actinoplanes sp.]